MPVPIVLHIGFLILLLLTTQSSAESPACLAVYRAGGAPAVFQSPNCPRWTLLAHPPPPSCHLAAHLRRRPSEEDRAVCALDIRIPFLWREGIKEVSVSIIAIFGGHNGAETSDLAPKLLLEYFMLHVYFLLDEIYSEVLGFNLMPDGEHDELFEVINVDEQRSWRSDSERFKFTFAAIRDDAFHMEILKKSLLRTVHDIDAIFWKEASSKNLDSGSTATVVLITDGHILTTNSGDSKALLCSENTRTVNQQKGNWSKLNRLRRHKTAVSSVKEDWNTMLPNSDGRTYHDKELTKDHHPERDDEMNRIEAANGYVGEWSGVLRVNDELAVSRAIGDIPFKNYGVISTREVTDWHFLSSNVYYLVVASDGIFEKLTTEEVCNLLWDEKIRDIINPNLIPTILHSLAESIIKAAFERGTVDNMAVVVLPLGLTGISGTVVEDDCDLEESSVGSRFGKQQVVRKKLANDAIRTDLVQMDYFNQIVSKFNRVLVEEQYRGLGCFYLSENLNENMDYVVRAPKNCGNCETNNLYQFLREPLSSYHGGGHLDLYKDQKMCWHFGNHYGDKSYCTSPEVFAKFLDLLDSVPYRGSISNSSELFGNKFPDFRYVLRKKFDRGSYGEVWLGFHWNCSQESDALNGTHRYTSRFARSNLDPCECNRGINTSSSTQKNFTDPYDNMVILKRIMVERGRAAYLSGLREKYFGETFLNASISVGGLQGAGLSTACSMEERDDPSTFIQKNVPDVNEIDYRSSATDLPYLNFGTSGICSEEGLKHIARYVESFESKSKEIWLVFQNEGMSLSKLMYKAEEVTDEESNEHARNILILHPSPWWHWLRTTEAGKKEMQNLIRQLLLALKSCHDRNITHRDIKPENMIVCFEDERTGRRVREIPTGEHQYHLRMRIIDFGSAIDDYTLKYLYESGPTRSEQTYEYTPPEALLNASWFQGPKSVTLKYDMWSVGVVMLEMILGSPHVFQISGRTRALMDRHLEGWSDHTKELAYKLRSYMEMCILIPGISPQHHPSGTKDPHGVSPASWKCSEESFSHQVKSRDPLNLGFPNVWALRLVRQLLVWHPPSAARYASSPPLVLSVALVALFSLAWVVLRWFCISREEIGFSYTCYEIRGSHKC